MKIIYGTDLTEKSSPAGQVAAAMARRWEDTLIAATVVQDGLERTMPHEVNVTFFASINDHLHSEASKLEVGELQVEEHILIGTPDQKLVDLADRENARLVVIGPSGRREGEWFHGTVGLSGTPDLFPALRLGRIASYDPSMYAARRFLINGDVYPGDSGAPVFMALQNGDPKLVGMVIQRLAIYENERSPIALAVDVSVIRETLALLAHRMVY